MNTTQPGQRLQWNLELDSDRIGPDGGMRHLVVTVRAPRPEDREGREGRDADHSTRPPLDLALVIDASGSMRGRKLAAARTAARGVVERLGPRDRVSLVSFATAVHTHATAITCDDHGRGQLIAAIDGLHSRDMTDLGAGWLEGCDHVAAGGTTGGTTGDIASGITGDTTPRQRRVLVLSDGMANRGITDPDVLGQHAAALRDRGIYTSAVGIGDDYSPVQLEALAEHGGGRLHDAPLGEDIVAVVLGELGEITATVADGMTLVIEPTAGVAMSALGPYATEAAHAAGASHATGTNHATGTARATGTGRRRLTVHLGTLAAGATRQVVLQAAIAPVSGSAARRVQDGVDRPAAAVVTVMPSWRLTGGERMHGELAPARIRYADPDEDDLITVDPLIGRRVAELWAEQLKLGSMRRNTAGDRDRAREAVLEALPGFRAYCAGIPGTGHLVDDLEHHADRVKMRLSARMSRQDMATYRMSLKTERDYRTRG